MGARGSTVQSITGVASRLFILSIEEHPESDIALICASGIRPRVRQSMASHSMNYTDWKLRALFHAADR